MPITFSRIFNLFIVRAITLSITLECLAPLCCAQSVDRGFRIDGTAKGMADSTLLYLEIRRSGGDSVDSTYVRQERFSFSGKLSAPTERALISTKPLTDYKFLWLENTAMTFSGEKGSFRDAVFTGSKSQDEKQTLDSLIEAQGESRKLDHYASFISTHPGSIVSAHLLSGLAASFGRERTKILFDALTPEVKRTSYGKTVSVFLSLNADPKIGDHYTDFTQQDVNGNPVSLSDFKGRLVLLEFWGSWCGPCRKSNPGAGKNLP
ncbi:MAG: TlpA disulfide reductase family protein [Chryseolinea sp.]